MTLDPIADLADRLCWLPVDGSDPTGVPAPLAAVLTPVRRYVHTLPSHAPVNRVEYELLAALAWSGWSMRAALTEAVNYAKWLDRRSGSYKRAWQHLAQAGLWECVLVRAGGRRLALVRLTDSGRARLAQVGVTAVASEWDLIAARHSGGAAGQLQHTGALCAFLYHARRHGYTGEPCPILAHAGRAQPDVLIEAATRQLYVEVQGRGGEPWRRRQKWINQMALQGCVALCADTPAAAARLAREAQLAGVSLGYATDLTSLADGWDAGLWTLRWRSAYMPLELLDKQDT